MLVTWNGGQGERIPAYATRVVQDSETKIFSAEVYEPKTPYKFKVKKFTPDVKPLLIYECHIGMAQGGGRCRQLRRVPREGASAHRRRWL